MESYSSGITINGTIGTIILTSGSGTDLISLELDEDVTYGESITIDYENNDKVMEESLDTLSMWLKHNDFTTTGDYGLFIFKDPNIDEERVTFSYPLVM